MRNLLKRAIYALCTFAGKLPKILVRCTLPTTVHPRLRRPRGGIHRRAREGQVRRPLRSPAIDGWDGDGLYDRRADRGREERAEQNPRPVQESFIR